MNIRIIEDTIVSFFNEEKSKVEILLKSEDDIVECVTAEIPKEIIPMIIPGKEITFNHFVVSVNIDGPDFVFPNVGYSKGDRSGFEERKKLSQSK